MYVKLFAQLLDSTVWREPDHVLRLWITFLLVCDREGFVRMSIPGLADRAKVSLLECEEALKRLESPDPYSQSPEQDGARIVRVGEPTEPLWHIVNYERYRNLKDRDQQRERWREKKARQRERQRANCPPDVPPMSPDVPPMSPDVPPIVEGEGEKKTCAPPARAGGFEAFWKAYPKKRSKGDAERAWKKLHPDAGLLHAILVAIERAKASKDWQKDGGAFIPYPATWLNALGWEDELGASPVPSTPPAYFRAPREESAP